MQLSMKVSETVALDTVNLAWSTLPDHCLGSAWALQGNQTVTYRPGTMRAESTDAKLLTEHFFFLLFSIYAFQPVTGGDI